MLNLETLAETYRFFNRYKWDPELLYEEQEDICIAYFQDVVDGNAKATYTDYYRWLFHYCFDTVLNWHKEGE